MTNNIANINRAFYQEGNNNTAYRNFIFSLKSQKTRSEYIRSLHYYMAWLKMDVLRDDDNYDKLLHKDPKLITSDIIGLYFISKITKNYLLQPLVHALQLFDISIT